MNAYRELGMAMEEPYFLALLAEAQASGGLIDDGLSTLAGALVALPSGRDYFYKAELYRLQGELLSRRPEADEGAVEGCLQQALQTARQMVPAAADAGSASRDPGGDRCGTGHLVVVTPRMRGRESTIVWVSPPNRCEPSG
jgi:hypothetical protein